MSLTYPSRTEAMHYRNALEEAVEAARKGEKPARDALAWPEGLSRTLLRGLPLPTQTRNSLLRSGLVDGDNRLTVAEMLHTPEVDRTTIRNLLIGIDEFLRDYADTFEGRPGPADVATMRLTKEVQRLTPIEAVIVDERVLMRPPVELHTLSVRFDVSISRIRSRLYNARHRFAIALGPEIRHIATEMKADLGPSPSESDVDERIDAILNEVLPNDGDAVECRAKRLFQRALIEALNLERPARGC